VARSVAKELQIDYLDTGAMYRAVTYASLQEGLDLHNEDELTALMAKVEVSVKTAPSGETMTFVNGRDVTPFIRDPEINQNVSFVAESPVVRRELVKMQRKLGEKGGIVMDGRDIGTRVLPNAPHKFFLTASLKERARRRYLEMLEKNPHVKVEDVEKDIARRDQIDKHRKVDPLRAAPDSCLIDTTNLDAGQVVEKIIQKIMGSET
jgi:CMP/dCMP kinase